MTVNTNDDGDAAPQALLERNRHLTRGRWGYLLAGAVFGAVAGAIWRGYQAPFVIDDPFWRDFLTGPPAAGAFALAGAIVAYVAARTAASTAKRSALRNEWWDRTEWALTQVMSDDEDARNVGMAALDVLARQATPTEGDMIDAVTSNRFLGINPAAIMDSAPGVDGQ